MRSEKELYGADADNNRGKWITNYYLEESDEENYIIPQLKEHIKQYGFLPTNFSVMIEDIDFPVEVGDYNYLEFLFEVWGYKHINGEAFMANDDLTFNEAKEYCKIIKDDSKEYHIRYEGKSL